jgi:hypothetical protein
MRQNVNSRVKGSFEPSRPFCQSSQLAELPGEERYDTAGFAEVNDTQDNRAGVFGGHESRQTVLAC